MLDEIQYLKIGEDFNISDRIYNYTNLTEAISTTDFEKQGHLLNYNFSIKSVQNIDIGYESIVESDNSEFDSVIDIS